MRFSILLFVAVMYCSCSNQNMQSNDAISKSLISKEKKLWEAWKTHNRATWELLTANDYIYLGDDGKKTRLEVSKDFEGDVVLNDYNILDSMQCISISPDVRILTYNAKIEGTIKGKPAQRIEMEASVWAKRNGVWKNIFLHEVEKQ